MSDNLPPLPITDDHGTPTRQQYRVIEKRRNWYLLYDQMQVGEKVRHEFRIVKMPHDLLLYPGITLDEAKRRFNEAVENDYE